MEVAPAAKGRGTSTETLLRPKPLSFTNGALKLHANSSSKTHLYKECLRNHAASLGGHALDGCCEFMPSPLYSPSDPSSLKCAACGCHRNFHRRDDDGDDNPSSPSPLALSAPHMLLALSAAGQSAPIVHDESNATNPVAVVRKRFRTKFTREQKEKMQELSERLGWKMRKQDEGLVDEFCREIGVSRDVFKVWMHNNKNTLTSKRGDNVVNLARDPRDGVHMMEMMASDNICNGSSSSTPHLMLNGSSST